MLVGFLRTLDFILAESRKLANMIARQTPNFVCDVISLSGKKKKMLRSQKKKKRRDNNNNNNNKKVRIW